MATIKKKDLVDRISKSTETSRSTVKVVIQCFLGEIIAELAKDNRLEFRDFGVFKVKERAARTAQNPKTMEPVHVPPKRTTKFKMGRSMKERLNSRSAE